VGNQTGRQGYVSSTFSAGKQLVFAGRQLFELNFFMRKMDLTCLFKMLEIIYKKKHILKRKTRG